MQCCIAYVRDGRLLTAHVVNTRAELGPWLGSVSHCDEVHLLPKIFKNIEDVETFLREKGFVKFKARYWSWPVSRAVPEIIRELKYERL